MGNGDILTHYEARERRQRFGVASVMLARGALIKPWLFREIREGREWLPTPEERFAVVWRFVELLRDHFGEGERAHARTMRFLPWHLGFFCRYRPFPEAEFAEAARQHPLLQTRPEDAPAIEGLDALLRDARPEVHESLSRELLVAGSREEAQERALRLFAGLPPAEGTERAEEAIAEVAG